ncbi:MAG: cytidylate kinase-like family protein [Planctomycetaceae bacterium]|nr:cytidylate kinase-like family protein [Planctomycetaceae bacterium]
MSNEQAEGIPESVSHYLRAAAYARAQQPQATIRSDRGEHLTVAISREAGIDAGAYARAIGQQLGWPVWDRELLELIAGRLGSRVSELETLDERHISWIQESLEAFLFLHTVNQQVFVRHLSATMHELAQQGNCIIVGRGAPHILPPWTTLKVRLVAPRDERIASFSRQLGLADLAQAQREMDKIDRERTRFVAEHFHKDPRDPASYDVVLNTAHFSRDECARLVIDFLHAFAHPREASAPRLAVSA